MKRELRERLEAIFHGASDLRGAERTVYLQKECEGDAALRAEVESLLRALDASGEFLEAPAPMDSLQLNDMEPRSLAGRTIGSYQIVRFIHEGGMGYVYEAEQSAPHRLVAIKIMKGVVLTRDAARRFSYESEILARLRHPNIAQVYEAGTCVIGTATVPYFAMEYLADALPVTQFAAQRAASIRDKLLLFLQVCDAIQFAHQKGVIHLDLKPSNILVESSGRAKVIDFGNARILESEGATQSLQTQSARLAGTIAYMSPEHCDGDPRGVDARGDIYSLGIVMYELLCGALPYDASTRNWNAASRIIKESPPRSPRAVNPLIPEDLELILLKTLEKEPSNRYPFAAALSRDIRRFLNHEPVEARAPSAAYRLKKLVIRNKAASALIAALVISIVIFMGVLATLYTEASAQRNAALEQQRQKSQYYQSLLNIVSYLVQPRNPDEDRPPEESSAELLDQLTREARVQTDPRGRAHLLYLLGMAQFQRKYYNEAAPLLRDSLESGASLPSEWIGQAHAYLAKCYFVGHNYTESIRHGMESLKSLKEPITSVFTHQVLRDNYYQTRDFDKLLIESREVVRLILENPANAQLQRALDSSLMDLGIYQKLAGDFAGALDSFERAIEAQRARNGPGTIAEFSSRNGLGSVYYKTGNYKKGLECYENLLALVDRNGGTRAQRLQVKNHIALMRGMLGDYEQSLAEFADNLILQLDEFGPAHVRVGQAYSDKALVLYQRGSLDAAAASCDASIAVFDRERGPTRTEFLAAAMHLRGKILCAQKDLDRALSNFNEAIAIYQKWVPEDNYHIAEVRQSLGACLLDAGRRQEARECFEKSADVIERVYGAGHARSREARARLAAAK